MDRKENSSTKWKRKCFDQYNWIKGGSRGKSDHFLRERKNYNKKKKKINSRKGKSLLYNKMKREKYKPPHRDGRIVNCKKDRKSTGRRDFPYSVPQESLLAQEGN